MGVQNRGATYSFRAYTTDINLWVALTDILPHQQSAAIIFRFTGAAREMARSLTPNEVLNGGVIHGQPMDPVSYILYGLEIRFAQLADEARLAAMNEITAFQRMPHESINAVLARYQLVRQGAIQTEVS